MVFSFEFCVCCEIYLWGECGWVSSWLYFILNLGVVLMWWFMLWALLDCFFLDF